MNPWSEKWLRQVAGWRAVKLGREWFDAGLVSGLDGEGDTWRGRVGSGQAARRVMVRVSGPGDVSAGCGCRENAATGEVCAHAAALIWAVLSRQQSAGPSITADQRSTNQRILPTAPAEAPATPFEIELSPRWIEEIAAGALGLRIRPLPGEPPVEADQRFAAWLPGGSPAGPQLLRLSAAGLPGFFAAIDGHPRLNVAKRTGPLLVVTARFGRLPVAATPDPAAARIGFQWRGPAPGNRLFVINHIPWLWSPDTGRLESPGEPMPGWGPSEWRDLAAGRPLSLPADQALPALAAAADLFQIPPGSWLDELRTVTLVPRIQLELEGSLRALDATIFACYDHPHPLRRALAGNSHRTTQLGWDPAMNSLLQADPPSERRAVNQLIEAGFALIDGEGGQFRLSGEDAVASFVAGPLQDLAHDWEIHLGDRWRHIAAGIDIIHPHLDLNHAGPRHPHCLRLAIQFSTDDGASLPNDQIRRLISSGRCRVPRARGRVAAISRADHQWLDDCLNELEPRQEDGAILIDQVHEPYLQEICGNNPRDLKASELCKTSKVHLDRFKQLFPTIDSILRDYQRVGLAWLWERVGRWGSALLADDMGLGKTLQVLAFLRLWQDGREGVAEPALVVCPTSVLGNWREQVARYWPECRLVLLHGAGRDGEFDRLGDCDLALASYGTVVRDRALHLKREYAAVVLDEASVIRNPQAEVSRVVAKLRGAARVALTGTPIENGVGDLWAIFRFLRPGYLGSHESFRERYEKPCADPQAAPATMRRLRCRIAPFLLRRLKEQVASELPPCIRSDQWCALSASQRASYRAIVEEFGRRQLGRPRGSGAGRMEMLTVLLRLRQLCCDPGLLEPVEDDESTCGPDAVAKSGKLERCLELLHEARANGRRVLVFSQFARILRRLQRMTGAAGFDSALLTGATRDREAEIARFRSPGGPPVFLISLKAGGYGLNLTEADVVIHFDPWWNPAAEAQATDRTHRIGQTKPVNVYRLLTRGTVEEHVLRLQAGKDQLVDALLSEDGQSTGGPISDEDLRGLLDPGLF